MAAPPSAWLLLAVAVLATAPGLGLAAERAGAGAPAAAASPAASSTPAPAADGSHLDRPTGADVAIVVFEDLQCPDCARLHPELRRIAVERNVPLVVRDYPLPRHDWAFPAAILARWFTYGSAAHGLDFRSFVFLNQDRITVANLREAAEAFAKPRGIALPDAVDPDGRLGELVEGDREFARTIGARSVPLVFVVGQGSRATRWVEVTDPAALPAAIDRLRASGRPAATP